MKSIIRKFLVFIFAAILIVPAFGATNAPTGDIGNYGNWMTAHNLNTTTTAIRDDISKFAPHATQQIAPDFVPPEVRVGVALMNGLSHIAGILDASLGRFAIIFMLIAFMFWMGLETYAMMTGKGDVWNLAMNIVKKGIVLAIWLAILGIGIRTIFAAISGPISAVGTYMSDIVLNSFAGILGVQMPDTCAMIHEYAVANASPDMVIDANAAADILCLPTRAAGFFYTAIGLGWQWMKIGVGHSVLTFVAGLALIILFLINVWKFMLIALGVMADLFLGIIMLPFTAIAETSAKTSYKGAVGDVFNAFLGIFKVDAFSLDGQILRFINAALYFISLSIVIGLCTGLMSGIMTWDAATGIALPDEANIFGATLTGLLVWYLANQADKIARDIGGSIDKSFGDQVGNTLKTMWKNTSGKIKDWRKAYRESKK